ncbi:lysophosphatidic acid receptor 4-like [Antedon mediterranea]|uniref:lysophosphatidic acid receptor 4-like n=1 Tax=Antedon mediterranea TaxID=105859 RepID=UPI003AF8DB0F
MSPVTEVCRILTIIIGIVAIITNMITFFMLCCIRQLRKRQNVLIANLAVADFLVGVFATLMSTTHNGSDSLTSLDATTNAMFSLLWVFAVSFERFLAVVVAPFRYRYVVTKCKLTIACICLWIFSLIFISGMSMLLIFAVEDRKYMQPVYFIYLSMTCVVGLMYAIIFGFVKRQSDTFERGCASVNARHARLKSLFVTFAILFGLLCCCLLPNQLFMMYVIHTTTGTSLKNTFQAVVYDISHVLLPLNSALNPFVYWWRIPEFRSGYKRLLEPCFSKFYRPSVVASISRPNSYANTTAL